MLGISFGLSLTMALADSRLVSSSWFITLVQLVFSLLGGLHIAALVLAIAGAHQLVRRTSGSSRSGAQLVLGCAIALAVLLVLSSILWGNLFRNLLWSRSWVKEELEPWISGAGSIAWLGLSAGLVLAAGRRGRMLAVPLLLATLLGHPFMIYRSALPTSLISFFSAAQAVLALLVLRRGTVATDQILEGTSSRTPMRRGLQLAARAHIALAAMFAADVGSTLLLIRAMAHEGGELVGYLWLYGVPLVCLFAGAALTRSILLVAELPMPRGVRRWLHAAAGGATVVTTLWCLELHHGWFEGRFWFFPVMMLGFALLWSVGLSRLATWIAPSARASVRPGIIVAVLASAAALLIACFGTAEWAETCICLAGLALMSSQLALGRGCRALAERLPAELELPKEIPVARLV